MKIKVSSDVLQDIKAALQTQNKNAVRFELTGFG
jgi:hypothetical protein